jgi:hypothetical protein
MLTAAGHCIPIEIHNNALKVSNTNENAAHIVDGQTLGIPKYQRQITYKPRPTRVRIHPCSKKKGQEQQVPTCTTLCCA